MKRSMKQRPDRERGDRPFPWQCPACLRVQVTPSVIPYTANVKHDGSLHAVEIPALEVPKCQACGELIFSSHVDEQINQALRAKLRLLTPDQIRGRRRRFCPDQKELATRLGVAKETISRWETGALIQSRAMDNLLRVFFELPQVRDVLIGENQDALPGTGETPSEEVDPPDEVSAARFSRFSFAKRAYGEDGLVAEVSRVKQNGTLLPIC
jgi:putative zinc finger/helix-turn-helix YgiT family protein